MSKVKDMTVGRPFSLILKFALPLMFGNLLQQTYSLVDAVIVGKYLNIQSLASIGASTSVLFFILGFCNGCCGGFGIPIAQKFGAKDFSMMRRYVNTSIRISIVLALVLTFLTCLLCRKILVWMSTPDDIFEGSYIYLFITFLGIPATFLYNLLSSIIRALGDSKTPFYFLILSTVLNIVLDLLFILVFDWKVAGAAWATLVSQFVATVLCWIYMRKNFPILQSNNEERKVRWQYVSHLLGVGVPMGLQFSITAIGSMMLQNANNGLGTSCVAAFTSSMRIKMFFICPFENLGIAMATFCGQNYGAQKFDRILKGVKDAVIMMASYALLLFVIIWPFAKFMGSLFMDYPDPEILDYTEQFLHTSVCFYIALGTLCILRYSIQGLGYTKLSMFSGVAEMVARVFLSLLLVPIFGFSAICFGDPIAWVAADLFLIPAFIFVFRKIRLNN